MKFPRLLLTFGLAAALAGCSLAPNLPVNPFGPTSAPSATPAPTLPPAPTSTPTPLPAIRIEGGDRALFIGDYETARVEYRLAFDQSADADTRAEALWGMARTEFEAGRFAAAAEFLNQLTGEYPGHKRGAQAHFLLAEIHDEQGRAAEAAAEYGAYLSARGGFLDVYALERQGDAYFEARDYAAALQSYTAAAQAPRPAADADIEVKIGRTRAALGDYAGALAQYDAVAQATNNDFVKAQMDYLSGSAHKFLGQTDEMKARFLHAVENYPVSYDSYLSLVELLDAGAAVSDFDRGLVDYFAGQYDVALAAFDRYISAGLDSDGTARYYRALTFVELKRYEEAVNGFTYFIANYPRHPKWSAAWYGDLNAPVFRPGRAFTQWYYLNQHAQAAQSLRNFAAIAPSDPLALDYLMIAARVLERGGLLNDAANLWETIADQFSGDVRSGEAAFLAGITRYRLGDFSRAFSDFQRSLLLSADSQNRARALLWIGKAQTQRGDGEAARLAWTQSQSLDSTGYYSLRSRDLLLGRASFAPASFVNLDVDLASERIAAASWVRLTFSLPANTDLSGPGALASDPRFIRGAEFWELGLYDEARAEFEDLRLSVSADAANSFRLANYLLDLGLYRSGIYAIRQVLTLAGLDEHSASLQAADYFSHVRYGAYYRDLVEPAAQLNGFDPLFLFSVMRQESLFEGFVRSTAGARGLMQIVPATGADVALRLGWPLSFQPDMLYRPIVSVKLGAYYLASNRIALSGDLYGALAAYNAGPGNAIAWQQLAGNDPDLFLEVVRAAETRDYIRGVYEIYNIYSALYSPVR